jgi:hypothetical protein
LSDIKFDVNKTFYEVVYYTHLSEIMAHWLSIENEVMKICVQCRTWFSQVTSKERLLHYIVFYSSLIQVLIHLPLKDANDKKGADTCYLIGELLQNNVLMKLEANTAF